MKTALAVLIGAFSTTMAYGATPWEQYLDLPTPANAARVAAIEYSAGSRPRRLSDGDLKILENQVFAQDAESFRLVVRLLRLADGAEAEDLGALLGHSIRAHPDFFLRQVAALNIPCKQLSWSLAAPGLEYVDRSAARVYEITMRRKALLGVRSKSLRHVRDECLQAFPHPPDQPAEPR
jgi:hypothetical protein